MNRLAEAVCSNRVVVYFDKISYAVYITHFSFLYGVLSVGKLNLPAPLTLVVFLAATLLSSAVLTALDGRLKIRQLR